MKNLLPATAARLLGLALLLATAAGCKKDNPTPSNTSLLTGPTWRYTDARLTINGVEGVYTPAAADVSDTKFTADGKATSTPVNGGTASTGTWAFASNETQLVLTPSSGTADDPYQIYTLNSTDLSLGYSYTQAQVQHALNNNNTTPTTTDKTILALVFSSSAFKFPANTTLPAGNQITSMSFRSNYKAR